mgnify:CR=1 FL=1
MTGVQTCALPISQETNYSTEVAERPLPQPMSTQLTLAPQASLNEEKPDPLTVTPIPKTKPPLPNVKTTTIKKSNVPQAPILNKDSAQQVSPLPQGEEVYFAED